MRALNIATDRATARAFFKMADKNGDKKISFKEFEEVAKKVSEKVQKKEQELIDAFQAFDRDNSGTIDGSELKNLVKAFREKTTVKSRHELLARFDKDHNGKLTFDEFRKMIKAFEEEAKEIKMAKRMFKKFDADKSGKIERKEL